MIVSNLALMFSLFILSFSTWAKEPAFYRKLAAYHAPEVNQGLGHNPRADVFTRIDFDGDLNFDNNWANVNQAEQAGSFVYYDVIETKAHWFITYGFFYPRDYAHYCFWWVCHENDFEGMRLTIEKTPDSEFGETVLMESQAHGRIVYQEDLTFAEAEPVQKHHVVVMIEKEGHGLHSINDRHPDPQNRVYKYSSNGQVPGGYELLPLSDLWATRDQVGRGKMWHGTFSYEGNHFSIKKLPSSFGGRKWGVAGANPPWAWKPLGITKGDWFFDPVQTTCHKIGCLPGMEEGTYLYNPYVGITPDSHQVSSVTP